MWLVTRLDAIDPGHTLGHVELGRILEAPQSELVHFFGDPAFMANVSVAAALVERREDPLHLGRAAARCRKPGTLGTMLINVSNGIPSAGLRQAGPSGFKSPEDFEWTEQLLRTR
jgi:hypothetical protein